MKKTSQGGFTLIELLVVIAIIGILASVVLASLNTARNKGADAATKSQMSSARAQAELFYDSNGNSYDAGTAASDVCNASGVAAGVNGINGLVLAATKSAGGSTATLNVDSATTASATTGLCNSVATTWAAEVPLKTGGFFCIDSTGKAQVNAAVGLANGTDYGC